jgi:DNA-binding CsgD family transcriptional regulator
MTAVDSVRKPPATASGWSGLFWDAFGGSRSPMILLDDRRCHVEVNGAYLGLLGYPRSALIGHPVTDFVAGSPASEREWRAALRRRQFTGVAELRCDDGRSVKVEFAGHPEVVTGRHLVLVVAMRTARGVPRLSPADPESGQATRLSSREREVIRLVALGLTSSEAAGELNISQNTVRSHVRNSMTKLGARSRAHLVAKALGVGDLWDVSEPTGQT